MQSVDNKTIYKTSADFCTHFRKCAFLPVYLYTNEQHTTPTTNTQRKKPVNNLFTDS